MKKKISPKKLRKLLLFYVIVIFACVFMYSAYQLFDTINGYRVAKKLYESTSSKYTSTDTNRTPPAATPPLELSPEEEEEYIDPEISPKAVNFDLLLADGAEVVAWIYGPGTVIDYPVVQTEDNQFYLNHMYNGAWNSSGTIFIDCKCQPDFAGDNTILYGHNMNDYSMFASLLNYKDQAYYEAHPVLYINSPEQNYRLELFAGFTTASDSNAYTLSFLDEDVKAAYIEDVKSQSLFNSDVQVGARDKLAILSTCTYDYQDARFIVIGKLIKIH